MFCDRNGDGVIKPENAPEASEVTQENHFYPFGLSMEAVWSNTPSVVDNAHQFNDKELVSDFGLNLYTYGFRFYDPSVARFWSVDPLAEKFPHYTPYQFAGNRVPNAIDLEGLEEYLVIKRYDKDNHLKSISVNTHRNSKGDLVNQQLSNSKTGTDYSKNSVLTVGIKADGTKTYQSSAALDKLSQKVVDANKDSKSIEHDKSTKLGNTESLNLTSNSKEGLKSSRSESADITLKQDFEFQFNKNVNTNDPATSRYLDSDAAALKNDVEVPAFKVEGQDADKIRAGLESRGVDMSKENKSIQSDRPMSSPSRILYGKYDVKKQ